MLIVLLLLSHFSRVQLCETPWTAAHQASPSLGFSRQEHWSGLPFPSPMHESEKWKWSRSVESDSQRPHGLQPTRLLHLWDFPGRSTGVGCHCLLRLLCYKSSKFSIQIKPISKSQFISQWIPLGIKTKTLYTSAKKKNHKKTHSKLYILISSTGRTLF